MPKGNIFKDYIYPVAVFAGGMIGVGFLSLPYVAQQTSVWLMLIYFIALTALIYIINAMLSEVSLQTPDFKRFPGFANYHLGKWGGSIALVLSITGSFGILLACLLVGSKFLNSIAEPVFNAGILFYTCIYLVICAVLIFLDIRIIKRLTFLVITFLSATIFFVFIEGFFKIKISNILATNDNLFSNPLNLFLPYGPILFSLWGIYMVPEVEEMLIGEKELLKRVILISTVGVGVMYFLFVLLIVGITGSSTTEAAFIGLKSILGDSVVTISLFVGFLATLMGFVTQAIVLEKILIYDMSIKRWQAFAITCLTPLILLLFGFTRFIPLISFIGGFLLGIAGIMVLVMYKKVKGKHKAIYPLGIIFILGMIYQIVFLVYK